MNSIKPRYRLEGHPCQATHSSGGQLDSDVVTISLESLDGLGDSVEDIFQKREEKTVVRHLPAAGLRELEVGPDPYPAVWDTGFVASGKTSDGRSIEISRSVEIADRSLIPSVAGAGLFYVGLGLVAVGSLVNRKGLVKRAGGTMVRTSMHLLHKEDGARYELKVGDAPVQVVYADGEGQVRETQGEC